MNIGAADGERAVCSTFTQCFPFSYSGAIWNVWLGFCWIAGSLWSAPRLTGTSSTALLVAKSPTLSQAGAPCCWHENIIWSRMRLATSIYRPQLCFKAGTNSIFKKRILKFYTIPNAHFIYVLRERPGSHCYQAQCNQSYWTMLKELIFTLLKNFHEQKTVLYYKDIGVLGHLGHRIADGGFTLSCNKISQDKLGACSCYKYCSLSIINDLIQHGFDW